MPLSRWFVGLDLGQVTDYTAEAIIECRPAAAEPEPSRPDRRRDLYIVQALSRYNGIPYVALQGDDSVVARVKQRLSHPMIASPVLALDQTGVGRPVVDIFRASRIRAALIPITITAGLHPRRDDVWPDEWLVPKKDLVATLQVLLQQGRLLIARQPSGEPIREGETLIRELKAFVVKVSASGHESFAAWRESEHDDLVLATALAIWSAERLPQIQPGDVGFGSQRASESIPKGETLGGRASEWPEGA